MSFVALIESEGCLNAALLHRFKVSYLLTLLEIRGLTGLFVRGEGPRSLL